MSDREIIKCNEVDYGSGWVDLSPNQTPGYLNLVVWKADQIADISNKSLQEAVSEGVTKGHVEIELSTSNIKEIIAVLQSMLSDIE